MVKAFKAFIMRGSVVDLAVGVIIGASFGSVVNSLVTDLIMPPIGLLLGRVDFSNLFAVLKEGTTAAPYASLAAAKAAGAVTLNYGAFVSTIVTFLIVALAVFLLIQAVSKLQRKEEVAPSVPAVPSAEEVLLTQIRDLLKAR